MRTVVGLGALQFRVFHTFSPRSQGLPGLHQYIEGLGRVLSVEIDKPMTRLTAAETGEIREADVSELAIREQLSRLLESPIFVHSHRLSRFLRFTVDTTLAGQAETLKEYLIGTEVYDRKPPYHPSADSIVRSEARRLRNKLKQYYESDGQSDSVFVYYRPGTYAPIFRLRRAQEGDLLGGTFDTHRSVTDRGAISVAVLPFVVISKSRCKLCGRFAQIIADELLHQLARRQGFRVCSASVAPLLAQPLDLPAVARKLNVHILFEGVIHGCGNRLRITARIVEASGFLISSERFDAPLGTPSLLKVSEQIASAMIMRVSPDIHPAGLRALPTMDNPSRQSLPLARLRWHGPRNVLRNTLGV
jgi:TolB-like protein